MGLIEKIDNYRKSKKYPTCVEITEEHNQFTIELLVPKYEPDQIEIKITNNVLHIGLKDLNKFSYTIYPPIELPIYSNIQEVKAILYRGILTIKVPFDTARSKNVKVEVEDEC